MADQHPFSRAKQIGQNISRLREKSDLTQEQLAEAAGVSARYIQELEAGKGTNPSLKVLCELRSALSCDWNELLANL